MEYRLIVFKNKQTKQQIHKRNIQLVEIRVRSNVICTTNSKQLFFLGLLGFTQNSKITSRFSYTYSITLIQVLYMYHC